MRYRTDVGFRNRYGYDDCDWAYTTIDMNRIKSFLVSTPILASFYVDNLVSL
jgi:hypothetical protein